MARLTVDMEVRPSVEDPSSFNYEQFLGDVKSIFETHNCGNIQLELQDFFAGLKIVSAHFDIEEKEGILDAIETSLQGLSDVDEVVTGCVSRALG